MRPPPWRTATTGLQRREARVPHQPCPPDVVRSLLTGWVVAGLLTMVVFGGAQEPVTTGAALLGFSLGWALLGVLSIRMTDPAAAVGPSDWFRSAPVCGREGVIDPPSRWRRVVSNRP